MDYLYSKTSIIQAILLSPLLFLAACGSGDSNPRPEPPEDWGPATCTWGTGQTPECSSPQCSPRGSNYTFYQWRELEGNCGALDSELLEPVIESLFSSTYADECEIVGLELDDECSLTRRVTCTLSGNDRTGPQVTAIVETQEVQPGEHEASATGLYGTLELSISSFNPTLANDPGCSGSYEVWASLRRF